MQYNCYLIITTVQLCFCLLLITSRFNFKRLSTAEFCVSKIKKPLKSTTKAKDELGFQFKFENVPWHFLKTSPFVRACKVILKGYIYFSITFFRNLKYIRITIIVLNIHGNSFSLCFCGGENTLWKLSFGNPHDYCLVSSLQRFSRLYRWWHIMWLITLMKNHLRLFLPKDRIKSNHLEEVRIY